MLNYVNSHQYPLSIDDLKNLKTNVSLLQGELFDRYETLEREVSLLFNPDELNNTKEYRLSLISDRHEDKVYMKKYKYEGNERKRIYEGYKVLDRR